MLHVRWAAFVAAGILLGSLTMPATAAPQATGERSWTRPQPSSKWKHGAYPKARVVRQTYRELPPERLLQLERANAARTMKPVRIGVGRHASLESTGLPPLVWVRAATGAVARVEIRSPDALALRVGLQVGHVDDRVELRFAGSDEPGRVVAAVTGDAIKRRMSPAGLFWTPSTDGDTQIIEIFRPAGMPAAAVRLDALQVSHLAANSRNDFKIIAKIGESGSCNVDTSCRTSELGQHFVDAKNAVAHMQFVVNGETYICSGTLLADTAPSTQSPYLYSANHCFATGTGAPDARQMQTVASTLNTFWNYEATSCRSGVSTTRTQLTAGATYLYSDERTDAMLIRLDEPAPAGAFFAGWSAEGLSQSSAVLGIHHPKGDAKKVSSGQQVSTSSSLHSVGWLSGTTEGGSSGSGLFTLGRQGYELRGGLYGGNAACSNSGSLTNTANRDHYSRFDVVFPRIQQYLATEPVARNGSEPLLPPSPAMRGSAPASVPADPAQAPPARSGAASPPPGRARATRRLPARHPH